MIIFGKSGFDHPSDPNFVTASETNNLSDTSPLPCVRSFCAGKTAILFSRECADGNDGLPWCTNRIN